MYLNGKYNYVTSFEIIKYDDHDIILVENYPCKTKDELFARERHWIEQIDCVNKFVPGRTPAEYYKKNKEMIAKKSKEYREKHRVEISARNKRKHEENRDVHLARQAKYRAEHREELARKQREYKKANNSKVVCICGSTYIQTDRSRHMKTTKHKKYINSLEYIMDIHKYVMEIISKYKLI